MLRTIAYIIFLCTGIFAFGLIVLFFRSQNVTLPSTNTGVKQSVSSNSTLNTLKKTYDFKSSDKKDIFGVSIFKMGVDIRTSDRIRMYVFEDDYMTVKKNLLLLESIYTFSEVQELFGAVLFLNDKIENSGIVRFVTEVDGVVLGFEAVKEEYDWLKGLLLQ